MKCLRCGYCCTHLFVIIVDDPAKGPREDNLICHEGKGVPCKHLRGNKPGEYYCNVHDESWYEETPCFMHGQIESRPDTLCRVGAYLLEKLNNETKKEKTKCAVKT